MTEETPILSEFFVQVVRLGPCEPIEGADSLLLTHVYDYPVVIRKDGLKEGDLAVYIPIDAIVNTGLPEFAFLGKHSRIKAKRLRGVYSQGLLIPARPEFSEGQDVQAELGITKYDPEVELASTGGRAIRGPKLHYPHYSVASIRRYSNVLEEGEEVVLTEKLHGANCRVVFTEGQLWVGSRHQWKEWSPSCTFWRAVPKFLDTGAYAGSLATILENEAPDLCFYGEAYGQVQDLKYGAEKGQSFFRCFDIYDPKKGWLDYLDYVILCDRLGLARVPVLYQGPWHADLRQMAEGQSTLANHVREGFVVRPVRERYSRRLQGRVLLKAVGEGYNTR